MAEYETFVHWVWTVWRGEFTAEVDAKQTAVHQLDHRVSEES